MTLWRTESRDDGQGLNSYIGLESIKAIQIKETVREINLRRAMSERIPEKKQGLKKIDGIGKVYGTLYALLTRENT